MRMVDSTPISQQQVGFTPPASSKPSDCVTEEQVIARLRMLMKVNLKNMCYQDAIFFADKLLHL